MTNRSLGAVAMAALLVLTAFAAVPVAAAESTLSVDTLEPTNVTDSSAELRGNLTSLGDDDSADVWFEYWVDGDPANATETPNETVTETGVFVREVTGLENNTTYVVVAHATNGTATVSGDEVQFTTTEEEDEATNEDAFGQQVVAELNRLMKGLGVNPEEPLGQQLSAWVVENNPGADHRSDKANPGGNGNGPPAHAGPPGDAEEDDEEPEDDES